MTGLLAKYARAAVPRYTSYPPATQFHDGVGEDAYAGWLGAIGDGDTLSLYLHIPFCSALCWYCGCHTTVPNDVGRVGRYVKTLTAEIDRVAGRVSGHPEVVHIHLGGGSPSMLSAQAFAALATSLRDRFAVRDDAAFACELDPRNLTPARIEAMAAHGVNRASLGVQDVSPDVQALINRRQPLDLVRRCVDQLRAAGIEAVNLDLMYGLPGQTTAHVVRSAEAAAALGADRIAVFGYAHVPWFKRHQRAIDEDRLPGMDERFAQMTAAEETLVAAGYVKIGLDHFARAHDALAVAKKAGRLRRNFQGYTADAAAVLLGFGASAIGALPQGYAQNDPHLGRYREAVMAGRLPVVRGVALRDDDRLRRRMIETLMCQGTLDLDMAAGAAEPASAADEVKHQLDTLAEDGLIEISGSRLTVTPKGQPYLRNIAACFDAYHSDGATRHSRAV
ncbi:MAG: oxygen-independent coproporphyrinogen III oxidase [Methyloligellaceae bacterium]